MTWEVLEGDVLRVARKLDPQSFDAILSDPPYGLSFMGNRWDYSVPSVNVFVELVRCVRPGGYAFFFGGTRTVHRMACNIEDCGFELFNMGMWLYGSAMPKSHDIAKAIDKRAGTWRGRSTSPLKDDRLAMGQHYGVTPKGNAVTDEAKRWEGCGTDLKPMWEPVVMSRRPIVGTYVENALRHGTGGLALDDCRIGTGGGGSQCSEAIANFPLPCSGHDSPVFGRVVHTANGDETGRWPGNVLLSHSPDCRGDGNQDEHREKWICAVDCPIRMIDEQSGNRPGMSGGGRHRAGYAGGMFGGIDSTATARGDSGGASRFFYHAKVGRTERDMGLGDEYPVRAGFEQSGRKEGSAGSTHGRASRTGAARNAHPTLKPIDLMRYFARMILPPPRRDGKPRRILIPYSGAGSEMIGALQAGWDEVVGIELSPRHAAVARSRIKNGRIIAATQKA